MGLVSLNQSYDHVRFHDDLFKLAGATASSHVLDVGCGIGRTLQRAVETASQVVGLDSNEAFLEQVRSSLKDAIAKNQLELLNVDLNREPLPFPGSQFDHIFCQNVLECIDNKQQLIADCYRCLKPNGVFLLSHHDFDGVMIHSSNTSLTRAIVSAYADETQNWMDAADGAIGRKLPGLMRSSDFSSMTTETRQFVGFSFAEGTYAKDYGTNAAAAAIRSGVSENETAAWLAELEDLDRRGEFYFSIPWIYVKALK